MNKKPLAFLLAAALASGASPAFADISSIAKNKGAELVGDILSNPSGLFFDWQQDAEAITPLTPGKWLGLNYHLGQFLPLPIGVPPLFGFVAPIPLPDPTTAGNISGKLRLHAEGRWAPGIPQIDVVGGVWNFLPSQVLVKKDAKPTDDTTLTDATLKGNYWGVILTSSLEPRMRLFWGYKRSTMNIDLALNKPTDVLGSQVQTIKTGLQDDFLLAGLEHPTSKGRYWTCAISYGVKNKLLAAKVAWYGRIFEMGLNVYPEGIGLYPFPGLPIHPTVGMHLNF